MIYKSCKNRHIGVSTNGTMTVLLRDPENRVYVF